MKLGLSAQEFASDTEVERMSACGGLYYNTIFTSLVLGTCI